MKAAIRASLVAAYDAALVDELLAAYEEAKTNYYLGGLRLSAVEGGRFAEAAFRMLQQETTGKFTSLGKSLPRTDKLIEDLENLPSSAHPDAVRVHIPRALRMVYDIRNKRDAAHLADNIDPNLQDATLVVSTLDWILSEFVRLHHNVSANDAQKLVDELVTRVAPVVQDFGGFLKLLTCLRFPCACDSLALPCVRHGTHDDYVTAVRSEPPTGATGPSRARRR